MAETGAKEANATRYLFLLCLLSLTLVGCQSMGLRASDPEDLVRRYTDERSRFIEVDGVRVHTRADGAGPAILMLHGALDSLHVWDAWAERLVPDYRVVRIDIPPFGLSGSVPVGEHYPDNVISVINGVLDGYGVASAVIVGNSLGGYFAAYYAAHVPQRVKALVLISPAGYPQPLPLLLRFAATPVIGKLFEYATPRSLVRRTVRSLYGDPERLDETAVQRRFDLIRAPNKRRAARAVIRSMAERADEEPAWISRITQPTLLLWGAEDRWVASDLARRWLANLPNARLVVFPAVGHVAMEEIPGASVAEFRRFVSGLADDYPTHDDDAEAF